LLRQKCSVIAPFWSSILDLSIKSVPEDQVRRLRERAKANHRSLQGELRALIDEATGTPRRLGIDEIVARVTGLNLTRRDEASAIVALLFNELRREEIVARLRDATLRAPSLIGFEVANACLKKIRAAPAEREALIEAFSLLEALSISLETVNLDGAIVLAERMKLSLYDVSYLWLAHARGAELVTLDDRLARADENIRRSK
jgi:antitoxin FitA